jgi:hypothetical protein
VHQVLDENGMLCLVYQCIAAIVVVVLLSIPEKHHMVHLESIS